MHNLCRPESLAQEKLQGMSHAAQLVAFFPLGGGDCATPVPACTFWHASFSPSQGLLQHSAAGLAAAQHHSQEVSLLLLDFALWPTQASPCILFPKGEAWGGVTLGVRQQVLDREAPGEPTMATPSNKTKQHHHPVGFLQLALPSRNRESLNGRPHPKQAFRR